MDKTNNNMAVETQHAVSPKYKPDKVYKSEPKTETIEETEYLPAIKKMFTNELVQYVMVKSFHSTGLHIQFIALNGNKSPVMVDGSPIIFSSLEMYKVLSKFYSTAKKNISFIISRDLTVTMYEDGAQMLSFGQKSIYEWIFVLLGISAINKKI